MSSIPRIATQPTSKPIAIFSDFDGTIFMQDTGHVLFDNFGCGKAKREELDGAIGRELSFRKASEELWGSLNVPLHEGLSTLKDHLVIDSYFKQFMAFTKYHNIPFSVISAGIKPLLRGALVEFLGHEESERIDIVSNEAEISKDGSSWKPVWRHDCELGHDKALSIKEFRTAKPHHLLVFIGDGVSDLPAASQADVLFARRGLKLESYCIEHSIPYIPFDTFANIEKVLSVMIRDNEYHNVYASPEMLPQQVTSVVPSFTPLTPVSSRPMSPLQSSLSYIATSTKAVKRPIIMRTRSMGVQPTAKSLKVSSVFSAYVQ